MSEIQVPKRRLGPKGPMVPIFSLGSWNTWDRMTPEEADALIQRAKNVDSAFFDIAYYNMGPHDEHSRTDILFGEAMARVGLPRSEFQVCGKLWLWEYPNLEFRKQIETSLARARLDRFDMVVVGDYFGEPDMERIALEVNELISEGMIGSWGINNWIYKDTRAALDFTKRERLVPPTFAQLKYSPVRRTMTEGPQYASLFRSGELSLQASDCLEGGILSGKGVPSRKIGADVGSIRENIYASVPILESVAAKFGASPVQTALAFCLSNPATANLLFGASKLSQFEDNLGAIPLANAHGSEIRILLEPVWLDKHVPAEGGF